MRQKAVSAITAGVVPDIMELADFSFLPLNAWADKLVDVSDIVEPVKAQYIDTALRGTYTKSPRRRLTRGIPKTGQM